MSILVNSLSYTHPDRESLFTTISFSVSKGQKVALVGNNGTGKSTLLRIIAGNLHPSDGEIILSENPYYVPQHLGQYDHYTLAQALGIEEKLNALHAILNGDASAENLDCLDDDWEIEERIKSALSFWNIQHLSLSSLMNSLSGGEKTKLFLAGISIHSPEIILLDEPSNHLDLVSRTHLYDFIKKSKSTILVVSHDRTLLNLLDTILELGKKNIETFGGNYDFYAQQKQLQTDALGKDIKKMEKELRKAKETERTALERQQKMDARGKNQQKKEGTPKAMMDKMKNDAEKSTARLKNVQVEKTGNIAQDLSDLRNEWSDADKMKMNFDHSALHKNKILIKANNINFGYDEMLWRDPLNFIITSGDRIAIDGNNGSGKTTLIKIILDEIKPSSGDIERVDVKTVYIDQNYSLIDDRLSVYEQAQQFNHTPLPEHEIKIRLNRFLFPKEFWDKPCQTLSGGERMRLMLCCLTISNQAPDIILLDEPTNNLDIQNAEILTVAVNEYKGTLLVVSHDRYFLEKINVNKNITLCLAKKTFY